MRYTLLATAATLALGALTPAFAADAYPQRPVTLIVPFGPGGTSDIMARFLQQPLAEALGATVVIENKGGAGGAIGMSSLSRAKPDGYTIGLSVIGPEILQPSLRQTGYAPEDFDHLCGTYDVPLMMMVKKDAPYQTLADVLQAARQQKDGLVYGSSGTGTVLHLSMEMLLDQAGATGLHIPYKSSGDMVTALMGDQIAVFNETPTVLGQYGLRALAVMANERLQAYPDVPTAAELGTPIEASVWGGLIAPAGLPPEVRGKLEAACEKAAHSAEYQKLANQAFTPLAWRTGKQYGEFVASERERYRQLIDTLDLAEKR